MACRIIIKLTINIGLFGNFGCDKLTKIVYECIGGNSMHDPGFGFKRQTKI